MPFESFWISPGNSEKYDLLKEKPLKLLFFYKFTCRYLVFFSFKSFGEEVV